MGMMGLKGSNQGRKYSWNRINEADRDKVVEIALEKPELFIQRACLAYYRHL